MASESDIIGRESGGNPYVGYSGVDLSNAPLNKYGFPIWSGAMGPAGISHAAGLYQFEPKTWEEGASALGITDFSPASQKKVYDYTREKYGEAPWAASAPLKPGEHRWVGAPSGGGGQPLYLGTLEKNFHDTGNGLLDALLAQNYPKEDKPTGNGLLDQIMQQAVFGLGPPNQAQPAPDAAKALGRIPQALPPQTVPELSGQQVDIKPLAQLQSAEPTFEKYIPKNIPDQIVDQRTQGEPSEASTFQPEAAQPPAFQQVNTGNGLLDRILKQLSPIASAQAAEAPTALQPVPATPTAPAPVQPPPAPAQPQAQPIPQQFIEPPAKGQQVPPAVQPRAALPTPQTQPAVPPARPTLPSEMLAGQPESGVAKFGEATAESIGQLLDLFLKQPLEAGARGISGQDEPGTPQAIEDAMAGAQLASAGSIGRGGMGAGPRLPERIEPTFGRAPAGEMPSEALAPTQPEISPPVTPPGAPPPTGGGEMPPATPVPPPPGIKETTRALDDDLFQAAQSAEADRLEVQHIADQLPNDLKGAADEQAYHERESRMTGKPIKPSATTQRIEKLLKPLDDKIHADATWIREHAPDIYGQLQEKPLRTAAEGHVHRKVVGQKLPGEALDPQQGELITGLGGSGLSRRASGMMHRTPDFVLEDNAGNRIPGKGPKVGEKGGPARYGETFVNPGTGVKYTVKEPTTAELEAKYPNRKYAKSLLANTFDNYLRLRRVRANIEILEKWKPELYDAGHWFPEASQDNRPANFVHVDVPQLRGWAEPHIAAVLNDIYRTDRQDVAGMLQKVNKVLIGSMFALPVRHQLNVGAHYMVGRGADWLYRNPMLARAYQEVAHQGPEYLRYLRAGAGLRYASTLNENFYNTILGKLFHEQMTNPEWEGVFKELGHKAADVVKAEYAWSRRALWKVNDVFLTARIMELEKSGKPLKDAIRIAEEEIPNYRLPTSNLFTRKLIQSPFIAFGRYDYGRARAMAKTVENMIGPGKTGEERIRAIGQALIMIGVGYYGYRAGNTALQEGQDKLRTALGPTWGPRIAGSKPMVIGGIGGFGPARATVEYVARKFGLDADEKNWATLLGSWMTLAPAGELMVGVPSNRNTFTGQPIVNEYGTPAGQIGEGAGFVAGQINPLQLAIESMRKGLLPGIGPQFGVQQEYKGPPGKVRRMLQGEARAQERRDPTAQLMKHILPKRPPTFGIPPEDFLK